MGKAVKMARPTLFSVTDFLNSICWAGLYVYEGGYINRQLKNEFSVLVITQTNG